MDEINRTMQRVTVEDAGSEDGDSERDDINSRLQSGRDAALMQRASDRMPRDLLKLWRGQYKTVQKIWEGGDTGITAKNQLKSVDNEIRALNIANGRQKNLFTCAMNLAEQISMMSSMMNNLAARPNAPERAHIVRGILTGAQNLSKFVDDRGLDWEKVVPERARSEVQDLIDEAGEEVQAQFDSLRQRPTMDQQKILDRARDPLAEFKVACLAKDRGKIAAAVRSLSDSNQEMAIVNKEHGLKPNAFLFPQERLEGLVQISRSENASRKQLHAAFEDFRSWMKQKGYTCFDALSANQNTDRSQSVAEENINKSSKEVSDYIPFEMAPVFQGQRNTIFGKIEHVRSCGSVARPAYRIFLNFGTEERPIYRVLNGSDLGIGAGRVLHEQEDLRGPSVDIRTKTAADVRIVRSIAVTDKKMRALIGLEDPKKEPPTYFLVEWSDQDQTWITKSDLQRIFGPKITKNIHDQMLDVFGKNYAMFKQWKEQNVDPDTKKVLGGDDATARPWLVTDDNRRLLNAPEESQYHGIEAPMINNDAYD